MKAIKILPFFLVSILFWISCGEEALRPIDGSDSVPGPVTNVTAEALSGGVKLSYRVPDSDNLLYIEAECDMGNDRVVNVKSSYYKDFLALEGFGDTSVYEIMVYAVGRNLKRSEPVVLNVKPLPPPIWSVYDSFNIFEDFGGLTIDFVNGDGANISISVETLDPQGEWTLADILYTSQEEGSFSLRGLDPVLMPFRIFARDRWGNRSAVMELELTPLYEQLIPKSGFREVSLLGDPAPFGVTRLPNLWSDVLAGAGSNSTSWYRTANGSGIPSHINFDMGVTAKLSRYTYWQRGNKSEHNLLYFGGSPEVWEVWGTNEPPAIDGSYDGWIKLLDCRLEKPSGQPLGNNTPLDIEVADRGHEFIFPTDAPPVRYIRIRVLRTFQVTDYFWMSELSFFGQIE